MVVSCLHTEAVNESFAGHFIVGLQYIVKILDRMIVVAHRMVLNDITKSDHFVDSTRRLTPLHMSCHQGLWSCSRHFLNGGANIDAIDVDAITPLQHALL